MTRDRHRDDPLAAMQAANPASAARLRDEVGGEELERIMRAAIAAGERPSSAPGPDPDGARPGRGPVVIRRRPLALAVGAACLAALAALALLAGLPGSGGGAPQYAAAAIEVAEANPRLLVTEPGWKVTRADEFAPESGELTFGDGRHQLTVRWYPARLYGSYLRDRAQVSRPLRSTLLGGAATTVEYGRGEYATMLAPRGPVFVEVRGRLGGRRAYRRALGSLRTVGVDAWLAAMPASVVTPGGRARAVERALRGVPLPPGFDRATLAGGDAVRDPVQLRVEVASAVACGWVESWLAARRAGDAAAERAAADALAGSEHWPLMSGRQMQRGWAHNLRHVAAQLERGHLDRSAAGVEVRPDGTAYEYGPAWSLALGCEPRFRRRR